MGQVSFFNPSLTAGYRRSCLRLCPTWKAIRILSCLRPWEGYCRREGRCPNAIYQATFLCRKDKNPPDTPDFRESGIVSKCFCIYLRPRFVRKLLSHGLQIQADLWPCQLWQPSLNILNARHFLRGRAESTGAKRIFRIEVVLG